jgi:hypothetical protein
MLKLSPFSRRLLLRLLLRLLISLMVGYVCFGVYVWWAMHQPPETFARVMSRMPGQAAQGAFSNPPRENSFNTCEKMLHTFIGLSLL